MKRTIITLFIISLTVLMASAQTAEDFHFVADGGSVRWQLVYESQVDSTAVLDYLLGSGNFADVVEISGSLSFTILPRKVDYRAAGFRAGRVAIYIHNYMMTGHGLLQIREGRYRVTVDHVVFQAEPDTPFETYALSRTGEFKPIFTAPSANAAQVLDYELTRLFTIRAPKEEGW